MVPWYCRYELPGDYGTFFLQVRCAVPALYCAALCCCAAPWCAACTMAAHRNAVSACPEQFCADPS